MKQDTGKQIKSIDIDCIIITKNKEKIKGVFNKNIGSITILAGQKYTLNKYQSNSNIQKKHWNNTQKKLAILQQKNAIEIIKYNGISKVKIKKPIKFNSPSGSACFIHASSRNGWTNWKLKNGKELKTFIEIKNVK